MAISTRSFTWDKTKRVFIGDASEVEKHYLQAYPDACDIGFDLSSDKTGRTVRMAETDPTPDCRVFIPANRAEAARLAFTVIVFNS